MRKRISVVEAQLLDFCVGLHQIQRNWSAII